MTPAILRPLIPEAIPFATKDVERSHPFASPATRDDLIRNAAEAIACSAHLRGMTVAEYVGEFAPHLVDVEARRAA